jgi:UDP-GlcNAc:undecaprenyl-phosphate/decaprenyl-phosphate GlcNAc-1-phosphate transferase
MKTYFSFFLIALLAALGCTPWTRSLGIRYGILDRPGSRRKIHQSAVPRLGGLAVLTATLLPFLGFLFYGNLLLDQIRLYWQPLLGLTIGSLLVFAVGFADDLHRLAPWKKLTVEVLAGLAAAALGLRIELFPIPFGLTWDLQWLSYPVTVLWLVGVTNAVNLADGIDGLSAGIAAFTAMVLFFMTYHSQYTVVALLSISLAGACVGFLRFNFYPATIFLGDSGSLFLGFYLGALSIWASEKSAITFSLLIPMVALGLPLADMVYAVIRRWSRGVPIKQADREHIHHKLLDMGFGQPITVLILYGVNILLIGFAGLLLLSRNSLASYILVLLGLALVLGSRVLGYFRFSRIIRNVRQRWRDLQQAKYITFRSHLLRQAFQQEWTLAGRWILAQDLFREVGFGRAQFIPARPRRSLPDWSAEGAAAFKIGPDFYLAVAIRNGQELLGEIKFSWGPEAEPLPAGLNKFLSVMIHDFGRNLTETE